MYIDTHLHLSSEYYDDIEQVIKRAQEKKVQYLIVSCCSKKDIIEGIKLLEKYPSIFLSVGFHPSEVEECGEEDIIWMEHLVKENKKIVAIGEIGLDYHYGKENKVAQQKLFKRQLDLAVKLNLPVVIHTREAVCDTFAILKQYHLTGVIHCFSGSIEVARDYIKLGYYLGIGGVLTFKNSKLSEVVKLLPVERILLETDSPYLSPEPLCGTKNEPANIPIIAERIAMITNQSVLDIANATTANANKLFDLDI